MLSRKIFLIPVLSHRQIYTTCSLQKNNQINKQVHMLKKIMAGREKGKRRFVFNEKLPQINSVQKISNPKGT